jgi:hypothetical protein
MLLVFSLSITPKRFLHAVFAKHIDNKQVKNNDQPYQLTSSGYNCDTDNLVAESPFEYGSNGTVVPPTSNFLSYTLLEISFTSVEKVYTTLRGPPVNI